jgi:hypothetical protein
MEDRDFLVAQLARVRRLAGETLDRRAKEALLSLAAEYAERIAALDDPKREGGDEGPPSTS